MEIRIRRVLTPAQQTKLRELRLAQREAIRLQRQERRIENGGNCQAVFGVVLPRGPRNVPSGAVSLTSRQNDVLQLLGEGASTDQIAAALHLSKETVRNHIRHILRALGAHSRLEAVTVAHRRGLLNG